MMTETQAFLLSFKEGISLTEQEGHFFLQSSARTTLSLEKTFPLIWGNG